MFYVKTRRFDYIFFTKSREERDILVHEFNAICENKNPEVQVMSARQSVMDLIDPLKAFNSYNLSMSCAPNFSSDHIIAVDRRSALYIRDGVRCYASKTMRKELYMTDGVLYKEPKD